MIECKFSSCPRCVKHGKRNTHTAKVQTAAAAEFCSGFAAHSSSRGHTEPEAEEENSKRSKTGRRGRNQRRRRIRWQQQQQQQQEGRKTQTQCIFLFLRSLCFVKTLNGGTHTHVQKKRTKHRHREANQHTSLAWNKDRCINRPMQPVHTEHTYTNRQAVAAQTWESYGLPWILLCDVSAGRGVLWVRQLFRSPYSPLC